MEENENDEISQKGLPDDLMIECILPLLPIKLLTQCKVLSKHYYSCISSRNFILKHTKQPLFPHPGTPVETLFIQCGNCFYLYSCKNDDNIVEFDGCYDDVNRNADEFHECNNEDDHWYNNNNCDDGLEFHDCYNEVKNNLVKLDVEFKLDVGHTKMYLVGSSNGLVCLGELHGKCFILYNPTTNQSHKYYPRDSDRDELIMYSQPQVIWGFGYVSSINDYKAVRILLSWNGEYYDCIVHVFSLKTNTWKLVEFDIAKVRSLYRRESLKLVNETLYWTQRHCKATLAFDLASETFEWFAHIAPSPKMMGRICLVGGCLCVMGGCISKCDSNPKNEVVIDIYNHRTGSIEHVTFGCGMRVDVEDEFIGFTKTGKVFVAHCNDPMLGLIDQNSERILVEFPFDHEIYDDGMTHIQSYVPTEVSPHPSTEAPSSST